MIRSDGENREEKREIRMIKCFISLEFRTWTTTFFIFAEKILEFNKNCEMWFEI